VTKESRRSVHFDREKKQFEGIDSEFIAHLEIAYPGVNVHSELAKMCCWLMSPKGARHKGTSAFIMRWLSNAPKSILDSPRIYANPLAHLYADYDEDLWKDCDYLLELNTKHTTRF
jgi:hypothetical protein